MVSNLSLLHATSKNRKAQPARICFIKKFVIKITTCLPNYLTLLIWNNRYFSCRIITDFEKVALEVFRFQYHTITVYRSYCEALKKDAGVVNSLQQIPFLPISFFKTHNVSSGGNSINGHWFESSGTTGMQTSRHYITNPRLYEQSFRTMFEQFYGPVQHYCILGLLPSYLERQHSSLVYMVNDLVQQSAHPQSGFYLYDFEKLAATLQALETAGQPTLLFGVTYALLDFAERHPMPLQHTTIIETGGMKGRKKELLRDEVHGLLKKSFGLHPHPLRIWHDGIAFTGVCA